MPPDDKGKSQFVQRTSQFVALTLTCQVDRSEMGSNDRVTKSTTSALCQSHSREPMN